MTDSEQPHSVTDRIARLETAMTGLKEMLVYREKLMDERIDRLDAHNRMQDQEQEKFATETKGSVKGILRLIWAGMSWLVCAVGVLLLAGALKVLGIV